ncbi:MAG: sulfatase [Verrucomicrobiota bacterium]
MGIKFLLTVVVSMGATALPMELHAAKPNVIIFLVDDMGLMDTSVPMLSDESGNPVKHPLNEFYRTPSMERLAQTGIRFSTFYAHSVCSPSRVSIMTGQNATRHHTTQWIRPGGNNRGKFGPSEWNWEGLKKSDVTLPRVLQSAGYKTIHVGKAHLGPNGHEGSDPRNLGFDVNIGGTSQGSPGSYYAKDNYQNQGKKHSEYKVPHLEEYHGSDTFLTEALTLEAIKEVKQAVAEEKPFFLHMSHYALHTPFALDPRFEKNYPDSKQASGIKFATMVEGMDKSLGDLLDAVELLELAQDTLVIFLGDNGSDARIGKVHDIGSSAPLRGMKGTHYEGGMRIPFIVSWVRPDASNPFQKKLPIAANAVQSQAGTIMDLFPTVLNLAGIENPDGHVVDGHDLAVLLTGKSDPERGEDNFLMHFPHDHRSSNYTVLRKGDWKLIYHYFPGVGKGRGGGHPERYELFDLKEDPGESENLAASHPEKLASMLRAMIDQLEAEGALYCEKDGQPVKPLMP